MDPSALEFDLKFVVYRNMRIVSPVPVRQVYSKQPHLPHSLWFIRGLFTGNRFEIYLRLDEADNKLDWSFSCDVESKVGSTDFGKAFRPIQQKLTDEKGLWVLSDYVGKEFWAFQYVTILLRVTAKVVKDPKEIPMERTSNLKKLSNDLSSLFHSGLYSDISLIVGNQTFKAHKAILASRCDYFAAMFSSNLKESTASSVEIKDIDAEDFECLLQFIYSGKLPELSESNSMRLLKAAHLLGLVPIVRDCESYLVKNVKLDNCVELYLMAEMYSCTNLKDKSMEFIGKNTKAVMETEHWNKLKIENSVKALGIVESIVKNS